MAENQVNGMEERLGIIIMNKEEKGIEILKFKEIKDIVKYDLILG